MESKELGIARTLRSCLGQFATGVTIVSFYDGDEARGMTVNSFTSVSLSPPLVLVSIATASRTGRALIDGAAFAINVLAADQATLAYHFSGKPIKGRAEEWLSAEANEQPYLPGTAATIRCRPWRQYDGGDHVLVLGEVTSFTNHGRTPLVFHDGQFRQIGPTCHVAGVERDDPFGDPWTYQRARSA